MHNEGLPDSPGRGERLTPADRSEELLPWRRADGMTRCFLAWMPVSSFPARESERQWLLRFTTLLGERLKQDHELEPHVFLEFKTATTVNDEFLRHSRDFMPLAGLGRHPGAQPPDLPSEREYQQLMEGKRGFRAEDHMADYCYWFLVQSTQRQCQLFQGLGGMSILYWKPDPKAKPPDFKIPARYQDHELFKEFDVKGMVAGGCAARDAFLPKSKQIVGAGLKTSVQLETIAFMLPLVSAPEAFGLPEQELKAYFELFDVYLRESPPDGGLILLSKHDLEEALIGVLEQMRQSETEPGPQA
ncbi:MAG: hypothetical protein ACLQBJ_08135 [Bryobacteraceae bacterium]